MNCPRPVADPRQADHADQRSSSPPQIEIEIATLLDAEERSEFLETLGLEEPGLDRLIREAYRLLGLATYFTVGPKEARAWTDPSSATRTASRRRHSYRFRKGLHPRRNHRL